MMSFLIAITSAAVGGVIGRAPFDELRSQALFRAVQVEQDGHAVVWNEGRPKAYLNYLAFFFDILAIALVLLR